MKKILSVLLAAIMILSAANIAVFAVDTDETKTTSATQVFADGSYIVVKLHESDETNATKATKTKTGSKDYEFHSSDGDLRWVVTVNGTFTYTGSSATCTKATVATKVYNSAWKIISATASKSSNKATANFTVKRYTLGIVTKTVTDSVTLTCSAKGVLS